MSHFEPRALSHAEAAETRTRLGSAPVPLRGRLVARSGDDARERALWEGLGKPPAFRFLRSRPGAPAHLEPWQAQPTTGPKLTVEVEQEWPLLEASGVWAHPAYPPGSCVSRGRALLLHPNAATSRLAVDVAWLPPGNYEAKAVYWTEQRECFEESLGTVDAPGWLDVSLSARQPRYFDRVELVRRP